jgi:hypothetical protein
VFVEKSIKNSVCGKGAVDPFLLKKTNSPFGETDPNSVCGEEAADL